MTPCVRSLAALVLADAAVAAPGRPGDGVISVVGMALSAVSLACHVVGSVDDRVQSVVADRPITEIGQPIVIWLTVVVADLHAFRAGTNESGHDKHVHSRVGFDPVMRELDKKMASIRVRVDAKVLTLKPSPGPVFGFHPTVYRSQISAI